MSEAQLDLFLPDIENVIREYSTTSFGNALKAWIAEEIEYARDALESTQTTGAEVMHLRGRLSLLRDMQNFGDVLRIVKANRDKETEYGEADDPRGE